MQWSDRANAGFTTGEPWFGLNENYPDINVESSRATEHSIWHHYRNLIDLRHDEDVLVYGEYELLLPDDEQLYVYTRTLNEDTVLVVLNWSDVPATVDAGVVDSGDSEILQSNYDDSPADPAGQEFQPYEAVVYRL